MYNKDDKEFLLIETIVKLAALNKILVKKGLFTDEELHAEMTEISKNLLDNMKQMLVQQVTTPQN